MKLFGHVLWEGPTIRLSEIKQRRFNLIEDNCLTCDRDGHGRYYEQCKDLVAELDKHGVRCWRPRGNLLVWDER